MTGSWPLIAGAAPPGATVAILLVDWLIVDIEDRDAKQGDCESLPIVACKFPVYGTSVLRTSSTFQCSHVAAEELSKFNDWQRRCLACPLLATMDLISWLLDRDGRVGFSHIYTRLHTVQMLAPY